MVHRVARTLALADVTDSGVIFEVAEVANADDYVLGGARIARSLRMTLEELPLVRSASDVLLHIERQHPNARGRLEECVSCARFEHCSVWRLDYGALVVLPTRCSVGAFSLEPTWYMTIAWESLSLP